MPVGTSARSVSSTDRTARSRPALATATGTARRGSCRPRRRRGRPRRCAEANAGSAQRVPARRHHPDPGQPVPGAGRLLAGRPGPGGSERPEHSGSTMSSTCASSCSRPAAATPCARSASPGAPRCSRSWRAGRTPRPSVPRPCSGWRSGTRHRRPEPGRPARTDRRGLARHLRPHRRGPRRTPLRCRRDDRAAHAPDRRDCRLPSWATHDATAPADRPLYRVIALPSFTAEALRRRLSVTVDH